MAKCPLLLVTALAALFSMKLVVTHLKQVPSVKVYPRLPEKVGQQIANTAVTAVDDGTIRNAWGSNNIDDEGKPTQKNRFN